MGLDSTGSSPVFPTNMDRNQVSYFLNQLKLSSAKRHFYYDANIVKATKELAELLVSLNLLRRFYRVKGNKYRCFPAYTRNRQGMRSTKTYTRKQGLLHFSLKALQILNISTPHSYYVLYTDRGIMTHKDALRLKLGGKLIMIVH